MKTRILYSRSRIALRTTPAFLACVILGACVLLNTKGFGDSPDTNNIVIPEFGKLAAENIIAHDDLFVVIRDKYPVSPGHSLIIARRAVARFQELTQEEKTRLLFWIDWTQKHLTTTLKPTPDAFNFGLNDGLAGGQTKPQFHFHIIPRYTGDVPDPRGGVRYVIPSKARYWDVPKEEKR